MALNKNNDNTVLTGYKLKYPEICAAQMQILITFNDIENPITMPVNALTYIRAKNDYLTQPVDFNDLQNTVKIWNFHEAIRKIDKDFSNIQVEKTYVHLIKRGKENIIKESSENKYNILLKRHENEIIKSTKNLSSNIKILASIGRMEPSIKEYETKYIPHRSVPLLMGFFRRICDELSNFAPPSSS